MHKSTSAQIHKWQMPFAQMQRASLLSLLPEFGFVVVGHLFVGPDLQAVDAKVAQKQWTDEASVLVLKK